MEDLVQIEDLSSERLDQEAEQDGSRGPDDLARPFGRRTGDLLQGSTEQHQSLQVSTNEHGVRTVEFTNPELLTTKTHSKYLSSAQASGTKESLPPDLRHAAEHSGGAAAREAPSAFERLALGKNTAMQKNTATNFSANGNQEIQNPIYRAKQLQKRSAEAFEQGNVPGRLYKAQSSAKVLNQAKSSAAKATCDSVPIQIVQSFYLPGSNYIGRGGGSASGQGGRPPKQRHVMGSQFRILTTKRPSQMLISNGSSSWVKRNTFMAPPRQPSAESMPASQTTNTSLQWSQ